MWMRIFNPRFAAVLTCGILALGLVSCDDDDDNPGPSDTTVPVPSAYVFESRFQDGVSSVNYGGQTVRNLLLEDITRLVNELGSASASGPVTMQDFLNLYDYNDNLNLQTMTTAGTKPLLETSYSAIATEKNLVGKISPATVIGTGKTADELLREWFRIIVDNSNDGDKLGTPAVYTTADGADLSELINKLLLGAVSYYQGTGVYLDGLLEQDNSAARNGTDPYTTMEHSWDEAFGYFGAARNYSAFSDEDLAGSLSGGVLPYAGDANSDGFIDFKSEFNFGFARNAGKRDKGGSGVDFTADAFNAALEGRTAIVNQATTEEIRTQQLALARVWEEVIAATIVHYINETLADVAAVGGPFEDMESLNKHWSEMRGFTMALQYNPFKQISDTQLTDMADIMGMNPPISSPGSGDYQKFLTDYATLKTTLGSVYGFSSDNMENW